MKHQTKITPYGFRFGPANVVRLFSDDKLGVWLEIQTPKQNLEIRVTNKGLIKVGQPRPPLPK